MGQIGSFSSSQQYSEVVHIKLWLNHKNNLSLFPFKRFKQMTNSYQFSLSDTVSTEDVSVAV